MWDSGGANGVRVGPSLVRGVGLGWGQAGWREKSVVWGWATRWGMDQVRLCGMDQVRPWGMDQVRLWGMDQVRPWGMDQVRPCWMDSISSILS